MGFPTNQNLPLSYVRPVVAVAIDTNAPAVANADEASRVLLWGEQLPAGIAPASSVSPLGSLNDAINNYGKRSTVARMMRAALSQRNVSGAVSFFGVGVSPPSGGTAGTFQVQTYVVDATGATAANPLAAGGATLYMGGTELASVSWTTSDTATTIGAALATALNALEFAPFGTFSASTGNVTATCNIKGAVIEDYPIRVVYARPGTGVYFGPGSLTLLNNVTGAGSFKLLCGTTTITVATAGGETPTQAGDLIIAALGGVTSAGVATSAPNDYPITCGKNVSGVVPIYFTPAHDYRRLNVTVVTSTGVTAQLAGGSVTDGDGLADAGSITYAGTPGAGYPTVSTAVTNVRASGSFGKHVAPWIDATTIGAIFGGIVSDGDGGPSHQKGQTLTLGSVDTEANAAAFPGSTSPSMTAMTALVNEGMRGVIVHCPDAAQPGYELAARAASLRASSDPFTNYDSLPLTGTADVPLLLPSQMAIGAYGPDQQNQAIKDGLTPLGVQDGQLEIIFGRNTAATTASELWDWSWIDQADNHRLDVRAQARAAFAGAALISPGTVPKSRKDVDPRAITSFLQRMLRRWEAQGTYDGADALASQCDAQINPSNRGRADAVYPESPKVPLHQIGIVAQRQSPPTA